MKISMFLFMSCGHVAVTRGHSSKCRHSVSCTVEIVHHFSGASVKIERKEIVDRHPGNVDRRQKTSIDVFEILYRRSACLYKVPNFTNHNLERYRAQTA